MTSAVGTAKRQPRPYEPQRSTQCGRQSHARWRDEVMAIIDVQVHAYERNHPGRPWVGHLHGPQSANGEEMVAAMDAVGVDAAIIVSTFNLYRFDPSFALEVYRNYPTRFRVVKPIDATDPGI